MGFAKSGKVFVINTLPMWIPGEESPFPKGVRNGKLPNDSNPLLQPITQYYTAIGSLRLFCSRRVNS